MATDYVDFASIKQTITIAEIIPWLNLKGAWHGDQWRGACPHCHSGGDRVLVVTKSKAAFYCWALKRGGDSINLVAHVKNISQRDAAQLIQDHFNFNSTTPPEPHQVARAPVHLHEAVAALEISAPTTELEGGYNGVLRIQLNISLSEKKIEAVFIE